MARLHQRRGEGKLALLLLRETFERQGRYRLPPEQGGDVDIRFGHLCWEDWAADPLTYRQLAGLFRAEGNAAMAAEMFGVAAEVQGRALEGRARALQASEAEDVKRNEKARAAAQQARDSERLVLTNAMLRSVLDRAQCLSELAAYEVRASIWVRVRVRGMTRVRVSRAGRLRGALGKQNIHAYPNPNPNPRKLCMRCPRPPHPH